MLWRHKCFLQSSLFWSTRKRRNQKSRTKGWNAQKHPRTCGRGLSLDQVWSDEGPQVQSPSFATPNNALFTKSLFLAGRQKEQLMVSSKRVELFNAVVVKSSTHLEENANSFANNFAMERVMQALSLPMLVLLCHRWIPNHLCAAC